MSVLVSVSVCLCLCVCVCVYVYVCVCVERAIAEAEAPVDLSQDINFLLGSLSQETDDGEKIALTQSNTFDSQSVEPASQSLPHDDGTGNNSSEKLNNPANNRSAIPPNPFALEDMLAGMAEQWQSWSSNEEQRARRRQELAQSSSKPGYSASSSSLTSKHTDEIESEDADDSSDVRYFNYLLMHGLAITRSAQGGNRHADGGLELRQDIELDAGMDDMMDDRRDDDD